MNLKKILIITSSGGGGLLQAAIAKEQEILAEDPSAVVIKRDMMKDWYWKGIGQFGIRKWDDAQKKGDVAALEWLLNRQGMGDLVFWPRIFFYALSTFLRENVDRVLDTQPQGTSAILQALRVYNAKRNKQICLEKIIVDLPTKKNTHFFRPIKELSPKNRKWVRVVSISPLVNENETKEEFWQRYCNLSERAVRYEYYPIRQAFLKYKSKPRTKEVTTLTAELFNEEEKSFLSQALDKGSISYAMQEHKIDFTIDPEDKLITLLLGSQPAYAATLGYVKKMIELVGEDDREQAKIHLFVLCAHHRAGKDSLLRRVTDLVIRTNDFPSRLSVIPLSFQSDKMIAPLFHRSDVTCTRSGGQTAMELMCVMQGEMWIHSETKRPEGMNREFTLDELLKGIPGWEAGNAFYLHKFHQAKVVTTETFAPLARQFLKDQQPSMQNA